MRVLRYEVPVDDQEHSVTLGRIVHVASRSPETVEVWALDGAQHSRTFPVFGTGQPVPDPYGWEHVGTALVGPLPWPVLGPLVWHLFEAVQF